MNHFIWDRSPEIFSFGPFEVRFYGLFFALGFLFSYGIVQKIYQIESKPAKNLDYLLLYIVIGTLVGARLGHCLFYNPSYYLSNPIEILKFYEGGLASHGGGLGILLAIYLYSRRHIDQPFFWLVSRISIAVPLVGSLIRLGNFFNSEILGKETDVSWAVVFANYDFVPRHPVQLYESLSYLLIFVLMLSQYKKNKEQTNPFYLIGLLFTSVFSARFVLEFYKLPQAAYESGSFLTVGQYLSIPYVLLGIFCLYRG